LAEFPREPAGSRFPSQCSVRAGQSHLPGRLHPLSGGRVQRVDLAWPFALRSRFPGRIGTILPDLLGAHVGIALSLHSQYSTSSPRMQWDISRREFCVTALRFVAVRDELGSWLEQSCRFAQIGQNTLTAEARGGCARRAEKSKNILVSSAIPALSAFKRFSSNQETPDPADRGLFHPGKSSGSRITTQPPLDRIKALEDLVQFRTIRLNHRHRR
jgi:hypothetical protein